MLYLNGLVLQENTPVMDAVNTNTINKRAPDMLDKDTRHTTAFDRLPWVLPCLQKKTCACHDRGLKALRHFSNVGTRTGGACLLIQRPDGCS